MVGAGVFRKGKRSYPWLGQLATSANRRDHRAPTPPLDRNEVLHHHGDGERRTEGVERPCHLAGGCEIMGVVTTDVGAESKIDPAHQLMPANPIVVGIDGSDEARRGLLFAADLAEMLDTDLVVVHAYGLVGSVGDWRDGVDERERQVNAMMADEWCAPLADRGILKWTWRCVQGNAVGGVLRAADDVDAGFIVVGSHGAGNSAAPLLGSTSHFVVRNSHRPVIVIPPADNHPHRRGGAGAMSDAVADA